MVVQWHVIQPQKVFRALLVSACCIYCQQANQKREESRNNKWWSMFGKKKKKVNVRLLHICLHTSHFTFSQKSQEWLGFSQRHLKPNLPNSNLETAFYLTVLKSYRALMLVLNTVYFAFQVQFGSLWVLWHCLVRGEKEFLRELLLSGQHCPHKHKSETDVHTYTPLRTILQHFELCPCIIITILV